MSTERDTRTLRLLDLSPHDTIVVECVCGRIVEYLYGVLPRLHRVPSTTLIWDLQFRLRCSQCGRRDGFGVSIRDERERGDSANARKGVIVPCAGRLK